MILFAEDWARYPTAVVDLQTKNRSFVRLASVYREMGIKNHAFILALVNPELQGVDPFSPHLTEVQMAAIAIECKINPWYYFREVARAPAIGSDESVPVEANRGNIALWWSFFNHIFIILIQIRQTGKSFSTDTLMSLLMNILCQNTKINLLTKDDQLRRTNIQRLKDIMEELPPYLRMRNKDDVNNGEEITVRLLNNTYSTHVPQSSPKNALKVGRGLTSAIFHIDEGPFQPNISISLPAALAATGAAVDKAKAAGTPYGTIMTTTAGKKDDRDGKFVYTKILQNAAEWTEKFFDAKDWKDLNRLVRAGSRDGSFMVNATFNHRQLGKTDEWLRQKLEESRQTGEEADRDYFNRWTSGSMTSPLSIPVMEAIARSQDDPSYIQITPPHAYTMRWYIPEHELERRLAGGKFILGMDPSEAGGGDDISAVVVDVETLETLGAGTFNETNLIAFAQFVCSFLVRWENIIAIIERRSMGAMLLDYLLLMLPQHGIDPFKRLFNQVVQLYDEKPERFKEIQQPMARRDPNIYVRHKTTFGFSTSATGATSRTELYSTTLQLAARQSGDKMRDKVLINQVLGLVTRNGRIDHAEGEHDDLVIGWLLCQWLLRMGKNLAYYGIDSRQVMSRITGKEPDTLEKRIFRAEQQRIREQIEELYEQLSNEEDDWVALRMEQKLRLLDKQLVLEEGEDYSLDALLEGVKEAKRHRRQKASLRGGNPYDQALAASSPIAAHHYHHGTFSDRPMTIREFYR